MSLLIPWLAQLADLTLRDRICPSRGRCVGEYARPLPTVSVRRDYGLGESIFDGAERFALRITPACFGQLDLRCGGHVALFELL